MLLKNIWYYVIGDNMKNKNREYRKKYGDSDSEVGGTMTFESTEKVKLGGEEYVRLSVKYAYSYGAEEYIYNYAKKLDDNLMCIIHISNSDTDKTPEYFEKMFD